MKAYRLIIVIVAAGTLALTGCAPDRMEGTDWHSGGDRGNTILPPGPEGNVAPPPGQADRDGHVVTNVGPPLAGRFTDQQKQAIVQESLISLMRVTVCSEEWLELPDGDERSTAALDGLTTKLTELGFTVMETTASLSYSPTAAEQADFRDRTGCSLVFLVDGEAIEADQIGNFYSYQGVVKGKVLNLSTGQTIATKTMRKRGRRALTAAEAAVDANEAASADLVTYLTDEIARRPETTSLVKIVLEVSNLDNVDMADDLRVGLQRRVGIYYVSLEGWDEDSQVGMYEILCRFDAERFLIGYIRELREGNITIEAIDQDREVITAERKNMG